MIFADLRIAPGAVCVNIKHEVVLALDQHVRCTGPLAPVFSAN